MKKALLAILISGTVFTACNSESSNEQTETVEEVTTIDSLYGASFSKEGAITVSQLMTDINGKDSIDNIVVEGELAEVCQKMGCWVKLKNEGGDEIFVKMRDHEFFVPLDATGKVYVSGKAMREVTPVEELRHYAEDAGESEDVILAITEPKEEVKIDAAGIIVVH